MSNTDIRLGMVFDEASEMVRSKNVTYEDAWKRHGWRGSLGKVLTKAARLENILWRGGNPLLNGEKEHPREIALDLMNHLAFMVMNMDDGKEWGNEETLGDWSTAHPAAAERLGMQANPAMLLGGGGVSTYQPGPEDTQVQPIVGQVPIPGDDGERPVGKPTPRKRPIKDAPQA